MADTLPVPPGSRYAIVTLEQPQRTAFFGDLASVVKCMTELELAFQCQVVRTSDDELVWPIHSKGGTA